MLADIVIDTNVLMHASNVSSGRAKDAAALLKTVLDSETRLCVDAVYSDGAPRPNSSIIASEYHERVIGGSLGGYFVAVMADQGRISFLPRDVSNSVRKWINQRIANTQDRSFLKTAVNSIEKILVSHDYDDFSLIVRSESQKRLEVDILDARAAEFRTFDGCTCTSS